MWFTCWTPSWTINKPNPINISFVAPLTSKELNGLRLLNPLKKGKGEEIRGWLVNITLHGIDSGNFTSLLLVYPLSTSTFYRYLVFSQERHPLEKYANQGYGKKIWETNGSSDIPCKFDVSWALFQNKVVLARTPSISHAFTRIRRAVMLSRGICRYWQMLAAPASSHSALPLMFFLEMASRKRDA